MCTYDLVLEVQTCITKITVDSDLLLCFDLPVVETWQQWIAWNKWLVGLVFISKVMLGSTESLRNVGTVRAEK